MTETFDCLILKYVATRINWNKKEIIAKRSFVLNKHYSEKFKLNPVTEIEIDSDIPAMTETDNPELVIAQLVYMEDISENSYNCIARFDLSDDETELLKIIDENELTKLSYDN